MNQVDLPFSVTNTAAAEQALLTATHDIARNKLSPLVQAIDQDGLYPADVLREFAAAGAMSAQLKAPFGQEDYGLAIKAMAQASRVCGATGFMMWCQAVCGLYLQEAESDTLRSEALAAHVQGIGLGGTALSNPMKSYAGIENFLLKAKPVAGGYIVNGTLPWVSNLDKDHYCGAIAKVQDSTDRELMFLLRCDAPGMTLRECPSFSGMEGTGTYALILQNYFVPAADVIADPSRPLIKRIRPGFVMLQCGMAAGVIQGAIDSMWDVEPVLGHVNKFLDDRPAQLQEELNELLARVTSLAQTPYDDSDEFFIQVLDARAHGAELSLRAAQSALMHQGARGYLMTSDVQRRVRESHFVAIVTPAIKHLRSEMARLSAEELPA
jgi:alkylation response protein AidB-like acyl-CoA dehydrogenase